MTDYSGGGGGLAAGITIGTSVVTGGSDGDILYNNGGVLGGFQSYVDSGAGDAAITIRKTPGAGEAALEVTNGTVAQASLIVKDNVTPVFTIADGGIITKTAQLRGESGTAAAPTYSFSAVGYDGYGWYLVTASNAVALSTGGAQHVAFLNNSQELLVGADSFFSISSNNTPTSAVGDVHLSRSAAATWQLGKTNSATPVAQILRSQGSRGGTDTNVAGGNWTLYSGLGTGTATPSELIFQTGVVQASGTTQHTLRDAAKITPGGFQDVLGELALNADYTNATAVMSNTALSTTVVAGRTYNFSACILFANSTAADGFLLDFEGGTATATNFRCHAHAANAAGAALAFTTANSTALATDIDVTLALTTQAVMMIHGTFVPATAGTFIIRASEKVDGGGTLTIFRGSWLNIRDANPL